ncbi:hypothetical protein [Mesorhizobium sp. 43Arga]
MAERSGKTAYPKIGVWYDGENEIHLSIEGQGFSTVNARGSSERGNPHLFKKLARYLRDAGLPAPDLGKLKTEKTLQEDAALTVVKWAMELTNALQAARELGLPNGR